MVGPPLSLLFFGLNDSQVPGVVRLLPVQAASLNRLLLEDVLQAGNSQIVIKSIGGDLLSTEDARALPPLPFVLKKKKKTQSQHSMVYLGFFYIN